MLAMYFLKGHHKKKNLFGKNKIIQLMEPIWHSKKVGRKEGVRAAASGGDRERRPRAKSATRSSERYQVYAGL